MRCSMSVALYIGFDEINIDYKFKLLSLCYVNIYN